MGRLLGSVYCVTYSIRKYAFYNRSLQIDTALHISVLNVIIAQWKQNQNTLWHI